MGAAASSQVGGRRLAKRKYYRVYSPAMAKVMISLPDELLVRVDAHAAEHGGTRSGAIRELAEAAFGERERRLAKRMRALGGRATGHGGDVVSALKAGRPR